MRDYMDRRVTPPKRVTSPIWGPPPPCKQALNVQKTVRTSNVKKNNSFVPRNLHGCKAREWKGSKGKSLVVYQLQLVSGKSGWKVNGKRFFGSSYGKFPGATEHLKRLSCFFFFFSAGIFQMEIRVPCSQSHLWHQFHAFAAVFRQMKLICTNGKRDSGTKLTTDELLTICPHREPTSLLI